jgi:hypothetical protein
LHPIGVFLLLAGAFLPIMDFFITNVALSSINASLHASSSALELGDPARRLTGRPGRSG